MTRPPNDQPRLWFKMVPNNEISADGTWTTRLLPAHHTVRRAPVPDQGDMAICSCESKGRYDASASSTALYSTAIWTNPVTGQVECVDCYLK